MTAKPQAYRIIMREEVIAALDSGKWIPAIEIFLDGEGVEIGTGKIILAPAESAVRKIGEQT